MNCISRSLNISYFISNRLQVFANMSVTKNYVKFTRNYLCWSQFLMKLHGFNIQPATQETQGRCFHVSFAKFLRIPSATLCDCFCNFNISKLIFLIHFKKQEVLTYCLYFKLQKNFHEQRAFNIALTSPNDNVQAQTLRWA